MKNYIFKIAMLLFYSMPIIASSINIEQAIEYAKNNEYLKKYNLNVTQELLDNEFLLRQFNQDNYKICTTQQGSFFVDKMINNTPKDHIKNIIIEKGKIWEVLNHCFIKACVKKGTIAIDIGAHVGTHTITMAKAVGKDGLVIAFEPQHKVFQELFFNLYINECFNAIALRKAVGNENKIIYLGPIHPVNEGARFVVAEETDESAPMITLDSLNLTNISFIKIDTENMEGEVLDGAKETIMRNRPILLVEVQGNFDKAAHDKTDMQKQIAISINKIKALNYHIFNIGDQLCYPSEQL